MKRRFRTSLIVLLVGLLIPVIVYRHEVAKFGARLVRPLYQEHTVSSRVRQFRRVVEERLKPDFVRAGIIFPPAQVGLVGIKEEKVLQVYASGEKDGPFRFVCSYPILAASGRAGPKLREGDLQVPEGIYAIESLNPNSMFHLAMRVNYPNEFDRRMATAENRTNPGGDIMIHGRSASVGCLAMGDPAIEDLFVLAALVGHENLEVVIAPVDFRQGLRTGVMTPDWTRELYRNIQHALQRYPVPQSP